jgi:DNA-directed RNA polymerase specialized sigma24 family protein
MERRCAAVAHRLVFARQERAHREKPANPRLLDAIGGSSPEAAEERLHRQRQTDEMRRAAYRLPERQRVALALLRRYGFTVLEVACMLGTTESAVKSRARRAQRALRAAMASTPLASALLARGSGIAPGKPKLRPSQKVSGVGRRQMGGHAG